MLGYMSMNPNYVHTITLYRKQENKTWERTVYQNCFWKTKIMVTQNGTEASQVNTYIVRIPETEADKDFAVSVGDIVVKGECMEEASMKSPNTATDILSRNKPDEFRITAVSDNTGHLMDKHYRLGG